MANILNIEARHTNQIIQDVKNGNGETFIANAYVNYDVADGAFVSDINNIAVKTKITPVANLIVSEIQKKIGYEVLASLGTPIQYNRIYLTNIDNKIMYAMKCELKEVSEIVDDFQITLSDIAEVIVG